VKKPQGTQHAWSTRGNELDLAFQLGLLTLPPNRRFRKQIRHHLRLENSADLCVSVYNSTRLLLDDDDLEFMQWLIEKADSRDFVSLGRLQEFELSRGRRDLALLQDRVSRCALGISIRYQDAYRMSHNTQNTILAFKLEEMCYLHSIWFEPSSAEKGVWIDVPILYLVIEAQRGKGVPHNPSLKRTETANSAVPGRSPSATSAARIGANQTL
jgi:hypothetical protein